MRGTDQYDNQVADVLDKATKLKKAIVEPVIDPQNGKFILESGKRNERLEAETQHTIYESCGPNAAFIQATHSNAVRQYCLTRGRMPSDDLLASAYAATENAIAVSHGNAKGVGIFESAKLDTADSAQAMMRDRMIALILPGMLQSVTGNIVSFIPGQFNQSEIFKVDRIAGKTFGDLTAGDIITDTYSGQYSAMDQRFLTGTGNGTITGSSNEFDFNSTAVLGAAHAIKKKSVRVLHDRNVIARDDAAGNLSGTYQGLTVTGTVDYATGVVHPVFSTAPANGIQVHVMVDIDIEKDPTLIPTVNHEMDSRVLYPHESAIAASTTLQALWGMRREFNLNQDNMAMTAMRNLLAADKDRKHLKDLYFFRKGSQSFDYTVPATGISPQDHYETLRAVLLTIDANLLAANRKSGLVGIVADTKSASIFKSMRMPHFEPAPGYRRIAQPHYVGRLFGMWDLYEDPQGTDYDCLCFAKGTGIGEASYVAGDAVPAMAFKHSMLTDLKYKNTLWELAYRDLQPFDGRDYLTTLSLVNA